MATLLDLNTIEVNSTADPLTATGDVLAAVQLRRKIRSAVLKKAGVILATALPTDDTRSAALELLAWAQRVVANPDSTAGAVFRLALVRAPDAATSTQILAATDQAIQNDITPIMALLAKGMHPG